MENAPHPSSPSDEQALRQILEVTRQLAASSDLASLLTRVMDAAKLVLAADRGSLFLYDAPRSELFTTIADGTKEIRLSINTGIAGECARTRQIINVAHCYQDPRFNPEVDRRTGYVTRSLITVPLVGLEDQLVGVMQLLNAAKGSFDARDQRIAEALASQAAVAIQRAMLLEERLVKIKLERDLALAREIQQDVLPNSVPVLPGYEVATFSQPADQTGGDIFDLITLPMSSEEAAGAAPHSLVILIADATGHGIGPALSVTQARSMLRLGLRLKAELDDLVRHINTQVSEDLSSRRFITAFMGKLELANHRVVYQSAGQGPIVHLRGRDGKCDFRAASTIPLGIMDDLPMQASEIMNLDPGDMLVLLTDGFYEAQNPQGKQLGNERVATYLASVRHLSAGEIVDGLVAMLRQFTHHAPPLDDLTAVIVKRNAR